MRLSRKNPEAPRLRLRPSTTQPKITDCAQDLHTHTFPLGTEESGSGSGGGCGGQTRGKVGERSRDVFIKTMPCDESDGALERLSTHSLSAQPLWVTQPGTGPYKVKSFVSVHNSTRYYGRSWVHDAILMKLFRSHRGSASTTTDGRDPLAAALPFYPSIIFPLPQTLEVTGCAFGQK